MNLVGKIKKSIDCSQYEKTEKVVLAYSGGVDTSVMVRLIQEVCDADVVTLSLDLGQKEYRKEDLEQMREKALSLGAKKHFFIDAKKEFVKNYISKAVKANSLYQGQYPNSTALGRPLIAKYLVEIAGKEGADAVAHGCTGKGNDQVRFDISVLSMKPDLKIIAPVRDWDLKRDEEMEYAKQEGIPIPVKKSSPYSVDANIWGRSVECGVLEHPHEEAPEDVFEWCVLPEKAPDEVTKVKLHFEGGALSEVEMNGNSTTDSVGMVSLLNSIAGGNGVGVIDHMEDRTIGLKSREVYECPAATVILKAHADLEKYVHTKEETEFKPVVDKLWSECVYKGLWHSPLMNSLNAFIDESQKCVTGWVKLKLYKGSAQVLARSSEYALYDHELATYNAGTTFNQKDSLGFIKLWGLNTVIASKVRGKK
jgi:argininosuccinate synthase